MALLRIKDLSFLYPNETAQALININIEVQKGEFILLCGPSGCGKTTLLRHIKPFLEPAGKKSGTILFNGLETNRLEEREAAAKIGLIMQNPESQIVTETVRHELAFGLECLGVSPPLIAKRVAETVSYFGIEDLYNKKNNELSGGEKQLVSIAAIMSMRPELILLDEPASQLDPIAARNLYDMLLRLNTELGITVILSEHRIDDVFAIADRVAVMNKGELICQNAPKQAAFFMSESADAKIEAMLPIPAKIYRDISSLIETNETEPSASIKKSSSHTEIPVIVRDVKPWFESMANKHLVYPLKNNSLFVADGPGIDDVKDEKVKNRLKRQPDSFIHLDSLYFRFEKNSDDVIHNLSLKINKGEILSIVGGNGAGKTTLLRLICGIIKPYGGKIKLSANGLSMAYLPQNPQSMFAYDTVLEDLQNVEGGLTDTQRFLKSTGLSLPKNSAISPKLQSIIDRLDIQAIIGKHPFDLSFGELQRAALAMLLLKTPTVLLLDEPTKGLDMLTKEKIAVLLKSLCADGLTVVAVTHDIEFAAEYSHNCGMLFDGRILNVETPENFFSGNMSYTTVAHRIAGNIFTKTITSEEVKTKWKQHAIKH